MTECDCEQCKLNRIINLLQEQGTKIMELDDDLKAVLAQVGKGTGEVLAKIADLETSVGNLQELVSENAAAKAELDAAQGTLADLKVAAQALDDIVPDPEPEPPTP